MNLKQEPLPPAGGSSVKKTDNNEPPRKTPWIIALLLLLVCAAGAYFVLGDKNDEIAEQQRLAQEIARKDSIAEQQRLAQKEQARQDSIAEQQRLAQEIARKDSIAEQQRLAQQEQARKEQAEQRRLAVQKEEPQNYIKDNGTELECKVNGVTFKMVKVDGGTFRMGSTSGDSDEQPVHSVTLSPYYIGETEVTQELWTAVMGSNPSKFTSNSRLPVECVSWNDCQEFIKELNALTGGSFRLPTEAEWEFAARGGNKSKGYKYSGNDDIDDVAWYYDNSGGRTHIVKGKQPNELGIYDMTGNVWEWCSDWYGDYSSASVTNPEGPSSGSYRVNRGGCWGSNSSRCRCAYRLNFAPDDAYDDLGFRLASW